MKQLEQTLTSIEVSEMVNKDHKNILRDIKKYIEELGELKIEPSSFFTDSIYLSEQNKTLPCYLVTKKGCEFIAHKLTGIKGTEFTAKYINKFHDMEDTIQDNLFEGLSTEMQALILHDKKIQAVLSHIENTDNRLDKLEYDIPLYGCESKELSDHVKRKGVQVLGGKKSNAYKDNSIRTSVYRDIYDQLKREFGLYDEIGNKQSYQWLKRRHLADAHEYIDCYVPPRILKDQIDNCNNQICLALLDKQKGEKGYGYKL